MSTERTLLAAAMDSREAFTLIEKHCNDDLTEQSRVILGQIADYYERDPSSHHVEFDTLSELVIGSLANPKHKETFATIMEGLRGTEVSGINVATAVLEAKREAVGMKLSSALATGSKDVPQLLDEFVELQHASQLDNEGESDLLIGPALADLIGDDYEGSLIRMFPHGLNTRLNGGMLRGHHVVVFARPDMGKTSFVINLIYGFLRQDLRTLYINNEEPLKDVGLRMVGRLTDRTTFEVVQDLAGSEEIAREHGWGSLGMKHMTPGTPREIEAICADFKPDVLVVDQLRNINVREDQKVQQLEKAANAVRQIGGRQNCLVVSVTQAGDSATGRSVLEMGDVDSSNTGIPGAVDVMIGIGATNEDEMANRRVLSLCKNKRGGGHVFFPVGVNLALSKFTTMD